MERSLLVLIFIFLLCASLVLGYFSVFETPLFSLLLVLGLVVCFISFFRPDIGIYILIVSLFFAPDIRAGGDLGTLGVTGEAIRQIKVRPEDFLIIFISIGWFFRMAMSRERVFIRTPIAGPIMVFFVAMALSTMLGIAQNYVTARRGLLFLMKKLEYFLIYFMVVNNIKTRRGFYFGLFLLFFSAVAVSLVGIVQYRMVGFSYFSITSTFGEAQANILGGFLLIAIPLVWAFFIISKEGWLRILLLIVFGLCLLSFFLTKSRGAYVGFVATIVTFVYISRKRWLIPLLVVLVCVLVLFAPTPLRKQVDTILYGTIPKDFSEIMKLSKRTGVERAQHWGTTLKKTGLDTSWAARVAAAMEMVPRFKKNFLFGEGLGAVELGYIDNQYVYDLVTLGIVGFGVFIWLLYGIARMINGFFLQSDNNPVLRALCLAFLSSFAGLLVQGLTVTNFYTIRTMTPFWFLLGLIVVEAHLTLGEGAETSEVTS